MTCKILMRSRVNGGKGQAAPTAPAATESERHGGHDQAALSGPAAGFQALGVIASVQRERLYINFTRGTHIAIRYI